MHRRNELTTYRPGGRPAGDGADRVLRPDANIERDQGPYALLDDSIAVRSENQRRISLAVIGRAASGRVREADRSGPNAAACGRKPGCHARWLLSGHLALAASKIREARRRRRRRPST
jgi:hypothetical protein